MPKLWRHICQQIFVLIAAITGLLISALILLRPDEITRLAAVSGSWGQMGIYFIVTLPYLLPIALPLATMAGCGVVMSKMIQRGEWLALTTAGFSPWQICAPVLSFLIVVGGINALICSELVQTAHLITERLKLDWAALRPLRALQPREPLCIGRIAVAAGGRKDESLDQFMLCYAQPSDKEQGPILKLILAKKLNFKSNSYEMLNHRSIHLRENRFDRGSYEFFTQSAERAEIPISMLRSLASLHAQGNIPLHRQSLQALWRLRAKEGDSAINLEFIRRASSPLLPIALGLIGLWMGAIASLDHRKSTLVFAFCLSLLTYLSPHIGKSLAKHWQSASIIYFLPPIAAILVGLRGLYKLRLG